MSAGLYYLILLGTLVLIVLAAVAVARSLTRGERISRAERRELRALRDLIHRIDRLAYNSRDVAPELSVQITDEIATFKSKELE